MEKWRYYFSGEKEDAAKECGRQDLARWRWWIFFKAAWTTVSPTPNPSFSPSVDVQCCTYTEKYWKLPWIRKISDKYCTILTNIESLDNSQSKSNTQPLFLPLSWRTMLYIYWKILKISVNTENCWQILHNTDKYWKPGQQLVKVQHPTPLSPLSSWADDVHCCTLELKKILPELKFIPT